MVRRLDESLTVNNKEHNEAICNNNNCYIWNEIISKSAFKLHHLLNTSTFVSKPIVSLIELIKQWESNIVVDSSTVHQAKIQCIIWCNHRLSHKSEQCMGFLSQIFRFDKWTLPTLIKVALWIHQAKRYSCTCVCSAIYPYREILGNLPYNSVHRGKFFLRN